MKTTKTRQVRLVIALAAAIGMALPATVASAGPHMIASADTPPTVCEIQGVAVNQTAPPIPPAAADGAFGFGANLDCIGGDKANVYDVDAVGLTTDIFHQGTGENLLQGGTQKCEKDGVFEYHTADIAADGQSKDLLGKFHFIRQGNVVLADGVLFNRNEGTASSVDVTTDDTPDLCGTSKKEHDQTFMAVATATPDPQQLNNAIVVGTAVIFNGSPTVHYCYELKPDNGHCDVNAPGGVVNP